MTDTIERAGTAWTEVQEDGTPLLCWDNESGNTKAIELSPEAAGNLRDEFVHGPSVRHDQPKKVNNE